MYSLVLETKDWSPSGRAAEGWTFLLGATISESGENKADILKISKQYTYPGRVSERMFLVSCTDSGIWAGTRGHVSVAGSHQSEDRIQQRKAGKELSQHNNASQNREGE